MDDLSLRLLRSCLPLTIVLCRMFFCPLQHKISVKDRFWDTDEENAVIRSRHDVFIIQAIIIDIFNLKIKL